MRLFILCFLILYSNLTICQKFKEVSSQHGLDYIFPVNDHREVGAGVIVFDVNNDGWDDIFQCGGTFPSKLWINNKGNFKDETTKYKIEFLDSLLVQGASSADFDNDGFEDLYICNMAIPSQIGDNSPSVLLRNVNGEYFQPVFQETFNELGNYSASVWGDINSDGFVDLYVLNYVKSMSNDFDAFGFPSFYHPVCLENKLYLNEGGKGFKEIASVLKLNDDGCGLAASFTDYDNDNDIDLILLNDFGQFSHKGNRLFRNEHPKLEFTDMSDSLGFYAEFYGMGVGPGDFNNDGFLDYYLTNIGKNRLYSFDNSRMIDKSKEFNVELEFVHKEQTGTSWSGLFLDVENDGDVDLYVTKGYLESIEKVVILDKNKLFLNHGDSFQDVSESSGINDSTAQRGAALLDFNYDGKLDIVSNELKLGRSEFAKMDQKIKLFKNESDSKNNWIGIKLIGDQGINRSCVGCSVELMGNGKVQIREVDGGSGHSSQSTKTLYFGLGSSKYAEDITIQWIGGGEQCIKKLKRGKVYKINASGKKFKN